jgi:hypothetical protein
VKTDSDIHYGNTAEDEMCNLAVVHTPFSLSTRGSVGRNNMSPGGPFIGECWLLRLCTWEPMCVSSDYSPGVVFQACVSGSGTSGSCSMM